MKRRALYLLVIAVIAGNASTLDACGDKFLGAGRGPRFSKVYAAIYPGRVVMYAPARGELANMDGLDKALRRAGHQVLVVRDLPTLSRALQERAIDVVLADNAHMSEAGTIAGELSVKPTVLPVSKSAVNFLRTLDDTMKSRLSLRPFTSASPK